MRWATDFLPWYIRQFMNLVTTGSPNFASGRTCRLTAARRRDMARPSPSFLLRPLGAVFGPALAAVLDALGLERTAADVVAHARQALDATPPDGHARLLLQILALPAAVARSLEPLRPPHPPHPPHAQTPP